MSKVVENHEVRSFGVLSLLLLLAAGFFIWMPAWSNHAAEIQEHTLHRAESLAYQVLESQRAASRGPASASEMGLNRLTADEGQVGVDPWGHPYNFKILRGTEFQKTKVVVWSAGPNGSLETAASIIDSNRDNETPKFSGDDLGVMVSIK